MTDEQIIEQWEEVLATGDEPIGVYWSVYLTTQMAKETLDMLNRQKETIQNQDEMIRALTNAQETLQKVIAEKDEHIKFLGDQMTTYMIRWAKMKAEVAEKDEEIEQWKEEANKYQNLWCEAVEDLGTAQVEIEKLKSGHILYGSEE